MVRLLALVAIAALTISGCTGDGSPAQSSEATSTSAEPPTADTGTVQGLVVDEEQQPVAGAQVALLDVPGGKFEGVTDASGAFSFGGVPPGSYRLAVSQLGYEALARKIDIVAGQVTEARVTLVAIAIATATHKTEEVAGFVGCSVTVATGQSAQPAATWVCGEVAAGNNWYPNHKNMHTWKVPKDYQTHIAELDWKMNSEGAKFMRMLMAQTIECTPVVCLVSTSFNEEKNGQRPVKIAFNYEDRKGLGKEWDVKSRVRSGIPPGSTPGTAVVLDQKYTIYVTNFFGDVAPENFTATPPEPI